MKNEPAQLPPALARAGRVLGWLFAFILSQLTPWLEPIFKFQLISEYYQPKTNGFASFWAVVGFFGAQAFYRNVDSDKLKRHLLTLWLPSFLVSFLICLFFIMTLGVTWDPGITLGYVLKFIWFILYFIMFLCIAVILRILLTLVMAKEADAKKG